LEGIPESRSLKKKWSDSESLEGTKSQKHKKLTNDDIDSAENSQNYLTDSATLTLTTKELRSLLLKPRENSKKKKKKMSRNLRKRNLKFWKKKWLNFLKERRKARRNCKLASPINKKYDEDFESSDSKKKNDIDTGSSEKNSPKKGKFKINFNSLPKNYSSDSYEEILEFKRNNNKNLENSEIKFPKKNDIDSENSENTPTLKKKQKSKNIFEKKYHSDFESSEKSEIKNKKKKRDEECEKSESSFIKLPKKNNDTSETTKTENELAIFFRKKNRKLRKKVTKITKNKKSRSYFRKKMKTTHKKHKSNFKINKKYDEYSESTSKSLEFSSFINESAHSNLDSVESKIDNKFDKLKMTKHNISQPAVDIVTPFSKLQIIWHDPKIDNEENKYRLVKYSDTHCLKPFKDHEEVSIFLRGTAEHWFLVTSGTNGQILVPKIHEEPAIIGIVIFCRHPEYHKAWASKFKKVLKIVNKSFQEVLENIKPCFHNYLCSYLFSSLDLKEGYMISRLISKKFFIENEELKNQNEEGEYLSISYELALQFGLIIKNLIKNNNPAKLSNENKYQIVQELMNLTEKNEEKLAIKERFKKPSNWFQSIIYTYTTKAIYCNFNKVLTSDQYDKILETLTYLFSCILAHMSQKKDQSRLRILYRGTDKSVGSEYMNNNLMFWKAFTSTSLDLTQAEKFTTNVKGTIFKIHLSDKTPHPFLILPPSWTKFKKEKEVLLWPNFAFKCVGCKKEKWYDYVELVQNESYIIATSDLESLKNWWKEYMASKIEIPFDDFFNRMRIRIKDALNFLSFYKEKEKFFFQENEELKEEEKKDPVEEEEKTINIKKLIQNNKKKEDQFDFQFEKEIYDTFKNKFLEHLKEKLFFSKTFPQEQKRFYQILIRDMRILELIEMKFEPFLLEIAGVVFKIKTRKGVAEILAENTDFFNFMINEIMSFVQERLKIYKNTVLELCKNYFEVL